MNCRLIAFDMDGTFFNDRKEIPTLNIDAVKRAAARGILIVPATGRIAAGLPRELMQLGIVRYAITANGAAVVDLEEQKLIYSALIPNSTALEVFDYCTRYPILYDCFQHDAGWMSREMYDQLPGFMGNEPILKALKQTRKPVDNLPEMIRENGEDVQKIMLQFKDMELRRRQLELLPGRFPTLTFSTSIFNNIEVNSCKATKGHGLTALCGYLGIDLKDAAAFGDGTNDTDMLRAAGLGVAMENAEAEVKAAADLVALNNNDAGVGAVIERLLAGEI